MNAWLDAALTEAPLNDHLSEQRSRSLALLREAAWPSRKVEAWKYTPVRPLEQAQLQAANPQSAAVIEPIAGLDAIELHLVDGRPQSLSQPLPEGVHIRPLNAGDALAQTVFGQVKPARHYFGLVNDVLAADGWVIDVAAKVNVEQPLRIVYHTSANAHAHGRVLVRVGEGASLAIVEQSVADATANSVSTYFAEYQVGAAARLEHYRFAMQTGQAMSVGGCHFELSDRSELHSTLVGFGSELARLDVDVIHGGEFASANMNAVYLLDGKELFDLHTTIEHAKPNGTTEENVRGIAGGQSRAVFNGRIHIHRHAQKTLAELNNRNLLLNRGAEINTKPELEIYADDVRCAHGATVAETDKRALYYLQSRGISRAQAQIMLNFGFINELVDAMPNAALAEWLRPQLRARFANMGEL
ncbi:Fe-S cluster assembly protein SufD [Simiduia sp. 21SJ11W-1]|uniref:Fe-S cluster assembly protein SufD n=1 Tax=Simiduia sp. 21SJ11W-1 TaxID=2909669 RepID=UPI00209F7E00|nr:Fe-S cluster assembly protein SufD [Simiduia sp. 21SJ11W-1]UTA49172.1 Fe-S cluster assembly protein SufD [Simiduia sp. 21SJ11W-1]